MRVVTLTEIDFEPGPEWVLWTEPNVPVKEERVVYVKPLPDGSFRSEIWVKFGRFANAE